MNLLKTLTLGVAACGIAASANASLIQTKTFGSSDPFSPDARLLGGSIPLTFDQYSGVLPLGSVIITLEMNIFGGSLTADNDTNTAPTFTISIEANGDMSSGDVFVGTFPTITLLQSSGPLSVRPDDLDGGAPFGTFQDDGGVDNEYFFGGELSDMAFNVVGSPNLAGYIGGGTFDISVDTDANDNIASGFSSAPSKLFNPPFTFGEVTIEYVPVPEPATNAAIGIAALATFAFIYRRRKAKQNA